MFHHLLRAARSVSRSRKSRAASARKRRFQFMEALEPRLALALSNFTAPDGTSWPVDQSTGMPYFHSYSAAPTTIYMDYDGDPGTKNSFSPGLQMLAWDTDGDPTHFMATEERNVMWEDWRRLSTYFLPFNVDVTTQYVNPTTRGVSWLCVSPTQYQFPGAMFNVGSFGKTDQFAYGFIGPGWGSETFAHEVGHSFGDVHQGNYDEFLQESQTYGGPNYPVNGGPVDPLNGAIMGAKNGVINKFLIWNRAGSNYQNTQDSQATIASAIAAKVGGTGYRPDDYANTLGASATTINLGTPLRGIIETLGDADYFKFTTSSTGNYRIDVVRDLDSPVDTTVLVQNAQGVPVASYNGDTRAANNVMVNDAHIALPNLAAGTYYIRVASNGNGGDIGPYYARLNVVSDGAFRSTDLGYVRTGGYATQLGGTIGLIAAGDDIWGTSDQGHFLYQTLSGDGDIVASPTILSNSIHGLNEWAKLGIMLRSSLSPTASEFSLLDTGNNGVVTQYRSAPSGETSQEGSSGGTPFTANQTNRRFKISRRGATVTAYISNDSGANWSQYGSSQSFGTGTIYLGLAATSHDGGATVTAGFTNVSLTTVNGGVLNPTGLTLDTSLLVPGNISPAQNGGGGTYITWPRSSDSRVTQYVVERSINNIDWATTSTVAQTATGTNPSLTQSGLNDNVYYYYRVRNSYFASGVNKVSNPGSPVYILVQPKAVTNLRSLISSSKIVLQWSDAAGETGYRIEYSDNYDAANPGAAIWSQINLGANLMTWGDISVPTRRAFRVHTMQGSTITGTTGVIVRGAPIPSVTNFGIPGITQGSPGTMTLSWSAPSPAVAGGVTYTVQRSETRRELAWTTRASGFTGTSYTDSTQAGKAYYYRVIAQSNNTGGRSVSSVVFRSAWGTNPAGYSDTDIGSVGGVGGVHAPNGNGTNVSVIASGGDIWGTSDNMHYLYKSITGSLNITVHVTGFGSGDDDTSNQEWARAGIAFRDGTGSGAASVGIYVTRKNGIIMQSRTSTNGSTGVVGQSSAAGFQPVWLKLSRSAGGGFTGRYSYDSADGTLSSGTWVTFGPVTISAIPNNYVGGLAVNSHDNNYLYTATFENLT